MGFFFLFLFFWIPSRFSQTVVIYSWALSLSGNGIERNVIWVSYLFYFADLLVFLTLRPLLFFEEQTVAAVPPVKGMGLSYKHRDECMRTHARAHTQTHTHRRERNAERGKERERKRERERESLGLRGLRFSLTMPQDSQTVSPSISHPVFMLTYRHTHTVHTHLHYILLSKATKRQTDTCAKCQTCQAFPCFLRVFVSIRPYSFCRTRSIARLALDKHSKIFLSV